MGETDGNPEVDAVHGIYLKALFCLSFEARFQSQTIFKDHYKVICGQNTFSKRTRDDITNESNKMHLHSTPGFSFAIEYLNLHEKMKI